MEYKKIAVDEAKQLARDLGPEIKKFDEILEEQRIARLPRVRIRTYGSRFFKYFKPDEWTRKHTVEADPVLGRVRARRKFPRGKKFKRAN